MILILCESKDPFVSRIIGVPGMELYYMVMNWGSLLMSIFLSQLRLHLTFERMLLSELDKFVKSAFPLTFPPTSGISLMTI